MTREDHLAWAKERALEEADGTSRFVGWTVFKLYLSQHAELEDHPGIKIVDNMYFRNMQEQGGFVAGLLELEREDAPFNVIAFIEGFN